MIYKFEKLLAKSCINSGTDIENFKKEINLI